MVASHDHLLVVLSVAISVLAAYAARTLSERVRGNRGRVWLAWLIGGAIANGICTCSMHYTAMAAFRLPVPVVYYVPTVLLSLVVSILGSAAALFVLSRSNIGWFEVLAASIFMGGVGISCMHYLGMAAMRFQGMHDYSPGLVLLSVVLAIVISWMALSLAFLCPDASLGRRMRYHGSSVLRGAANPVMHFVAMAAVTFTLLDEPPDQFLAVTISYIGLLAISVVPAMVLVVVLLTSLADRLQESWSRLQNLSRRLLEVQEEERRHLARELHDEFGQILASVRRKKPAFQFVAGL
jgi:two-component system sensor histidine kinase/response regulator